MDVKVIRDGQNIETTVYCKPTSSGIYLHWVSYTPKSWRLATLKTLLCRAYKICSIRTHEEKEPKHLIKVFTGINGHLTAIVMNMIEKLEELFNLTFIDKKTIQQ